MSNKLLYDLKIGEEDLIDPSKYTGEQLYINILNKFGANKDITGNPMGSFELYMLINKVLKENDINSITSESIEYVKSIIKKHFIIGDNGEITYDKNWKDDFMGHHMRRVFSTDKQNGSGILIDDLEMGYMIDKEGNPITGDMQNSGADDGLIHISMSHTRETVNEYGVAMQKDIVMRESTLSPTGSEFYEMPEELDLISEFPNIKWKGHSEDRFEKYDKIKVTALKDDPFLVRVYIDKRDPSKLKKDESPNSSIWGYSTRGNQNPAHLSNSILNEEVLKNTRKDMLPEYYYNNFLNVAHFFGLGAIKQKEFFEEALRNISKRLGIKIEGIETSAQSL